MAPRRDASREPPCLFMCVQNTATLKPSMSRPPEFEAAQIFPAQLPPGPDIFHPIVSRALAQAAAQGVGAPPWEPSGFSARGSAAPCQTQSLPGHLPLLPPPQAEVIGPGTEESSSQSHTPTVDWGGSEPEQPMVAKEEQGRRRRLSQRSRSRWPRPRRGVLAGPTGQP